MRKNKLAVFIISLTLFNCQPKEVKQEQTIIKESHSQVIEKPYANPVLIYGTDFASFFQTLYRTSNYQLMLSFTDSNCVKKFGSKQLLNYYKYIFKFDYSLGRLSNLTYESDTILLSFTRACIYGTRRKVVISCRLQMDSIKLIITKLNRNPFE